MSINARHFFWPDAPVKQVKLRLRDIDVDDAPKPLDEISEEELERFLFGKEVRYLDVDDTLEETVIEGSTAVVEAKAQAIEFFFLRLRELPIGQSFLKALREFAKADPLFKQDWKRLFPARASKKDQEEFCQEARRYYAKKMSGIALFIKELTESGEEVPDGHKQFSEYWLSEESFRPLCEPLYDALEKSEVAFENSLPCYEKAQKSGVELSESDWTFLWGFHQDFKAELDNNAAIVPMVLIETTAFKLARSRCGRDLQERILAFVVSLFGGGFNFYIHALVCRDIALNHPSLDDFKDKLKSEGFGHEIISDSYNRSMPEASASLMACSIVSTR